MNDFGTWLRRQIEARRFLARHAIELGSAAVWTEPSSGVLMTCEADAEWSLLDGVWAMGDSTLTRLMEANDPQDTIARCEAELAILDEHYILDKDDTSEAYTEFSVTSRAGYPGGGFDYGCTVCHYQGYGGVWGYGYCRTLRFLGAAYRHLPGYQEKWKP